MFVHAHAGREDVAGASAASKMNSLNKNSVVLRQACAEQQQKTRVPTVASSSGSLFAEL